MGAPTTDLGGIQQTIRALKAAGWRLDYVNDGEDEVKVETEKDATDAITAVDSAHLIVTKDEGCTRGYVFFVLGNDPEEVICDYTTNLSSVIDPLTDGWF